ncbi:MAG: flagellar basal-body MS-ring/collar protein FliF [Kofleriaceae bacterium]
MADPNPSTGPRAVASQLTELWRRQPRRRKALAVAVAIAVIGAVAIASFARRSESWAQIAEGSSPDDAQELLSTLQARGVASRLRGGTVEVEARRLDEARAIAAAAGLPRTGKGFELFDGSSLGQSSFAEQVNYRRALQGELARSITALAQVQGARVLLALGKKSVFKDQQEPPSASVALHLHAGQTLSAEQVRGVRQLVAASVEGFKPYGVVVVYNHGNLLDGAHPAQKDRRAEIENTSSARVRAMLERVVGAGKVSVVTTAVVDDSKVSETQELFDHANPALRSESRTVEGGDAAQGIGGIAGTRANLPGAPAAAPTAAGSASDARRLQETKNYELSRTVRQTTRPDAQLQRLHVAIVVDYKTGADGKPAARTTQELAELTALARQAAGIDDARGDKLELRSIQFASDAEATAAAAAGAPPAFAELPLIPLAIGGGVVLLVALLAIAALVRRSRRRRRAMPSTLALPAPLAELERVLEARPTAQALDVAERAAIEAPPELPGLPAGRPVRERVLDAVRGDVDRAAEVLTAWLAEPAPKQVAKGAKS